MRNSAATKPVHPATNPSTEHSVAIESTAGSIYRRLVVICRHYTIKLRNQKTLHDLVRTNLAKTVHPARFHTLTR